MSSYVAKFLAFIVLEISTELSHPFESFRVHLDIVYRSCGCHLKDRLDFIRVISRLSWAGDAVDSSHGNSESWLYSY